MGFSPRAPWAAVTGRTAASCIVAAALTACSGYTLFSMGRTAAPMGWDEYVTPRPAANPVEEAVVEVAQSGNDSKTSDHDIFYIVTDTSKNHRVECITVVEKAPSRNPYAEKRVTHYRVVDGRIAAMSRTANEFFLDADLERAIVRSASSSMGSPDPVLLYRKGNMTLSIASHAINECNVDVKIYKGDGAGGAPIASKRVAGCFTR